MTDSQFIPNTPEIQEEWRAVPDYEGLYEVSNRGQVRGTGAKLRKRRRKAGIFKLNKIKGYLHVGLNDKSGKIHCKRVHRLVAAAFIGPCPEGKEVNHRDGVKHNNVLDNLEYSTFQENQDHATAMGLRPRGLRHGKYTKPANFPRGSRVHTAKLTEDDVLNIRFLHSQGLRATKIHPLYDFVGLDIICDVIARKTWKHI